LNDVNYYDLQAEHGSIQFKVRYTLLHEHPPYYAEHISRKISFDLRSNISTFNQETGEWTDVTRLTIEEPPFNLAPPGRILFPFQPPGLLRLLHGLPDEFVWLPTPRSLTKRIVGFDAATRGFPSGISGGFGRMLYLSAATITTLGYGDIVPLSPITRALVASEAVLGVVLIGLFLNSLAHESAAGHQDGNTAV
jgi:hypothetical protein